MEVLISIVRPIARYIAALLFTSMDFLMHVVGPIAEFFTENLVSKLAETVGYFFKHKSNVKKLKDQVENLKIEREVVQKAVEDAERNGKEIFPHVLDWFTKANKFISDKFDADLKEDEEKAEKKCFFGLCPNFKSRYQLSKKAEKEAHTIADLLEKGSKFVGERLGYTAPTKWVDLTPTEYEAFDSRSPALNNVMEALQNDDINMIGVYGIGGVGKTTLVKKVADQAKKLFEGNAIAITTITQNLIIENIQYDLARQLDLKLEERNDAGRANLLRQKLMKLKRVLIILDDIWKSFKLVEIGIPSTVDHRGCKILMTSRDKDVLSRMGSQNNISIAILNKEEAWNLFKKMASPVTESREIEEIARMVVERCGGLPIALTVIGSALKDQSSVAFWKDTLKDMENPLVRDYNAGLEEVYSNMELSYKYLESDMLKTIFSLCSIMGHNASIEDLLKYGMGLGLFDGYEVERARNKVITLVGKLKARSLLNGSNQNFFDMHDVVRDVAIAIASRDKNWLALGRKDVFNGWSDQKDMENCELISLLHCEVSDEKSLEFPDQVFQRMKELKVLHITHSKFSPSSIGCLTNIRSLCLSACSLEDVAMVGDLKSLEILNLQRSSKITMLPEKIGQLTKLKSLDLSWCNNLNVITPGVLSRLSNLEELYLLHGFSQWEREGHEEPSCNARLAELKDLSKLTALEVEICDEYAMPQDLFSEKLQRHKVLIGQGRRYRSYLYRSDSTLQLEIVRALTLNQTTSVNTYEGVKKSLKKIDFLILHDVRGVKDVVYDLNTDVFSDLKHLQISDVSEIQYIVKSDQQYSSEVFPILESLKLEGLCDLEKICNNGDQLREATFHRLRRISVVLCHKLKNLFPYTIAKRLTQLEEIDIWCCDSMIELFAGVEDEGQIEGISEREDEEERTLVFPKLESLELRDLRNFTTFCSCFRYNISIQFSSLKKLTITGKDLEESSDTEETRIVSMEDHRSQPLFDEKITFPKLQELWVDSFKGMASSIATCRSEAFQNLTTLQVFNCNNLKNVFSLSFLKSQCFEQLRELWIEDCRNLEEVVVVVEGTSGRDIDDEETRTLAFPKLESLTLDNLPNLTAFCRCWSESNSISIQFPSLRELKIWECSVLQTFVSTSASGAIEGTSNNSLQPLFNEKITFPKLQQLFVEALGGMASSIATCSSEAFQYLTKLQVYECNNLKNVFSLSFLKSQCFEQLRQLDIRRCRNLKEVIVVVEGTSGRDIDDEEIRTLVFPKLDSLRLSKLPNLTAFCRCCSESNTISIQLPSLKQLRIWEYSVLQTFVSTSASGAIEGTSNNSLQPLFNEKTSFPKLEILDLHVDSSMKEMWHEQLYFSKVKQLQLGGRIAELSCSQLSQALSPFPALEGLGISDCGLEEIFQNGNASASHGDDKVLSQIRSLTLPRLPKMMHLWKEKDSFQNLTTLKVNDCHNRWSFVPLPNLVSLEVFRCNGIIKFMTASTAKSLVKLTDMKISYCSNIKEIVECGDEEEQVKDEITFPSLTHLELKILSNLECFSSSTNHAFRFPSLELLDIYGCRKRMVFTHGQLDTPKLQKVGNTEILEGSLNATIQRLFQEARGNQELESESESSLDDEDHR